MTDTRIAILVPKPIFDLAAEVFGSAGQAEAWFTRPAMGLNGRRPIDLLETTTEQEVVNDFLIRLQYSVYC